MSEEEDDLVGLCVCVSMHVGVCMYSLLSDSLWSRGLWLARLLCPWNFPGKNTGIGSHSLLQWIVLTQGSNLGLLHWQADSWSLSYSEGGLFLWNLILCLVDSFRTELNSWTPAGIDVEKPPHTFRLGLGTLFQYYMPKIKNSDNTTCWRRGGETGLFMYC